MVLQSLKVQNLGFQLEYEVEPGERLTLLTGDNGLGKSFLLELIWWSLTYSWHRNPALPTENTGTIPTVTASDLARMEGSGISQIGKFYSYFDRKKQNWIIREESKVRPGLVLFVGIDGNISVWDSLRNPSSGDQLFYETSREYDRPSAFIFNSNQIWNGMGDEKARTNYCNGLIRDWVSWQKDLGSSVRASQFNNFRALEQALTKLSPPDEPIVPDTPRRLRVNESRMWPVIRFPFGSVPLDHVGSGIKRIIEMAYLLIWAWSEHLTAAQIIGVQPSSDIIFLIDEIDLHLHPKWQRQILPALMEVLKELNKNVDVQLIATTHSPLVLASAEPIFDPTIDKFYSFEVTDDRKVELFERPWSKVGDASAWLRSDIFDLDEAMSVPAEVAIEKAKGYISGDRSIELTQIQKELENSLSPVDPFMARWLLYMEHERNQGKKGRAKK